MVVVHVEPTTLSGGTRLSLNNRQAILKHQLGSSQYEEAMLRFLAGTPVSGEGVPVHPADR